MADAAANMALKHRDGHNTIDLKGVSDAIDRRRCALRFFSDGGYVAGYGSAHAFALVLWTHDGTDWHRELAGTSANFFDGGSAFEAEVLALDAVISLAAHMLRQIVK